MIVRAFRIDGNHRYKWTKHQRSLFVNRTWPRTLRRNTISWWRSTTFSASSRLLDLNGAVKSGVDVLSRAPRDIIPPRGGARVSFIENSAPSPDQLRPPCHPALRTKISWSVVA